MRLKVAVIALCYTDRLYRSAVDKRSVLDARTFCLRLIF